jgi:hypothetical protein
MNQWPWLQALYSPTYEPIEALIHAFGPYPINGLNVYITSYMGQTPSCADSSSATSPDVPFHWTAMPVLSFHLRLGLPSDLLPSGFRINNSYAFSPVPYTQHAQPKVLVPIWPACSYLAASVCGYSLAGIVGSNPAGGMVIGLLWVLCVVKYRSLRRADYSSRGDLLSVIVKPR